MFTIIKKIGKNIKKFFSKIANFKLFKKPIKAIKAFGGYFKGAWQELRQVRWPNRKATWGMTLAVLLFTGFFIVLVILLDIAFKELFVLILK